MSEINVTTEVTTTGYEYDFMGDSGLLQDFVCIICRLIARKPQQLSCCGQILCSSCLQRWRESCPHGSQGKCPHCKQVILCFEDRKSHQKIISLRVRCTYNTNGCKWEGELHMLESSHLHACTYQCRKCSDCQQDIPKQLMKNHQDECPMRKMKCPYCPCIETRKFIFGEHQKICRYWLVECPSGCGDKIPRSQIEEHRKICNFQLVQCCYHTDGCHVMVRRSELSSHENECPKKLLQQKEIIDMNEKGTVAPITLQFKDFNEYSRKAKVWQSQPFYCYEEGYRVCLRVHPNGCLAYEGEYLACYIHLQVGHFDDRVSWPFKGVLTVGLKNQEMDDHHYVKTFQFLTCQCAFYNKKPCQGEEVNSLGIGDPQFIKLTNLANNDSNVQYLKDDRLVFYVAYEPPKQQPYNCMFSSNNLLFR